MRLGTRQTRYAPVQRERGRSLAESRRLTGPAGDIMLEAVVKTAWGARPASS